MKKNLLLAFFIILLNLSVTSLFSQIAVTTTGTAVTSPALASSYTSLANALAALNAITSYTTPGTIIFTLASGSATAPATGFVIGSGTLNPLLSATNTVTIINASGATVIINAGVGTATPASAAPDCIISMRGADYITIDGLILTDGNSTNPASMESGIAMFKSSATDGCNNNTIQNCTFNMQRVNNAAGSGTMTEGSVAIRIINATASAATTALTPTSTAGSNSNNHIYSNTINNGNSGISLYGYNSGSPYTYTDQNNDIGGSSVATANSILNFGGGGTTSQAFGIYTRYQYGLTISYNTINNNNGSGVNHNQNLYGIINLNAVEASQTTRYNTITVSCGATTSTVIGIHNRAGGGSNTVNINDNIITTNHPTATSGTSWGIVNDANSFNLNINTNILSINTAATSSSFGNFSAIYSTGSVTNSININSNTISATASAASTSAAFTGINSQGASNTASLSISSNIFQNILYTGITGGTAQVVMIYNMASPLNSTISNNNFNNLSLKTTDLINLILNYNSPPLNGVKLVQNNFITTACSRTATGATGDFFGYWDRYFDNSISQSNVSQTISNNNFSNVTTNSTGGCFGISSYNTYTSIPALNIYNNTISNYNHGGNFTGILAGGFNGTSTTPNEIYNNIVSNIAAKEIVGIRTNYSLYLDVYNNNINTLSSSSANQVVGFSSYGGTNQTRFYKNKINGLSGSNAGSTIYGIYLNAFSSFPTNTSIYNNFIGNLTATAASNAASAVNGIYIPDANANKTINIFYNTIYLNASSSGTNFSTSGIYAVANTTSTTSQLDLRNNIIVNTSTPNGTGISAVYRRSSGLSNELSNYASTSNNNLFYAGIPSASRLIYYDGTNSAQTIAAYKSGMFTAGTISPRDQASVSEDITTRFLSTTGSDANYLHINTTLDTYAESGGGTGTGISDDYDGNLRNGTSPDIGADEFDGTPLDIIAPTIAYSPLSNTCITGDRILIAGITDVSGVPTAGSGLPVLYWNVNSGSYTAAIGTFVSGNNYSFSFGGSAANGDIVSYYIVAQDGASTPNVAAYPSAGASGFTLNPPATSTAPTVPSTYTIYSLPTVTLGSFSDVCVDASSFALTGGSPTGGTYSGTGVSSGNFNPTTAGSGTHSLTYSYTDGNACTNTATSDIDVNALPTVTLGSFSDVCVNSSSFALSGGSPAGGTYSGAGVSSGNFIPTTAGSGTHSITYSYTDGNTCSSFANSNQIVSSEIDNSVTVSGSTITANLAAATYKWIDCGNSNAIINSEIGQSYTASIAGDYAVIVTVGSCSDTSACNTILFTGINNSAQTAGFSVFPNPGNGDFTVSLNKEEIVSLINNLGQTVQTIELNQSNNNSVTVRGMERGIYFLIGNSNTLLKYKVVVEK